MNLLVKTLTSTFYDASSGLTARAVLCCAVLLDFLALLLCDRLDNAKIAGN